MRADIQIRPYRYRKFDGAGGCGGLPLYISSKVLYSWKLHIVIPMEDLI